MTTTTRNRTTLIATIPQVDDSVRRVYVQDAAHARTARSILRDDRTMIDHLDGIDGIEITVCDEER